MLHFFISYRRQDEEFARRIHAHLTKHGFRVWLDVENISPSANWRNEIDKALKQCDILLLIMTPEALESSNVEEEWQYFHSQKKDIIPLRLRPVPRDKIHFQLNSIQRIDFYEQSFDEGFMQLVSHIRRNYMATSMLNAADPATEPIETPTINPSVDESVDDEEDPTQAEASSSVRKVRTQIVQSLIESQFQSPPELDLGDAYIVQINDNRDFLRYWPIPERAAMGRSNNNEIKIPSKSLSRVHAVIYRDSSSQFVLEDSESTNGTWLNDMRINPRQPTPLSHGDEITLALEIRLLFLSVWQIMLAQSTATDGSPLYVQFMQLLGQDETKTRKIPVPANTRLPVRIINGGLWFDMEGEKAFIGQQPVELHRIQFRVLTFLYMYAGYTFSQAKIVDYIRSITHTRKITTDNVHRFLADMHKRLRQVDDTHEYIRLNEDGSVQFTLPEPSRWR